MITDKTSLKWLAPVAVTMLLTSAAQAQSRGDDNVVTVNDSDGDRVVDTVDVDDDNDGITDINEIASNGDDVDTDSDGIPDRLDLDSDNDGVLDWQESGAVLSIDFSALRIVGGRLLGEVGLNGYIDALETSTDNGQMSYSLVNTDFPADNLPDAIDLDSDNDGLPDLLEAGIDATLDANGDARIDIAQDTVGKDGIADRLQKIADQSCCDFNGDGVQDATPRNTDLADLPDYQDLDSDNDGLNDLVELGGRDFDDDGRVDNFFDSPVLDGMDDTLLSIPLAFSDSNGNAVPDHIDQFVQSSDADSIGSTTATGDVSTSEVPSASTPSINDDSTTEISNTTAPIDGTAPIVGTTPINGTTPDISTPVDDEPVGGRDPAVRPGANIIPSESAEPLEDDPGLSSIQTGLNASGCSIQSNSIDLVLLLLTVLSIAMLGLRYTLRRVR